jgi:nitronate monooxygenase
MARAAPAIDRLERPIVLAPLGGGPSTPALAAAVSEAGGLGFLASGYLSAEQTAESVSALRSLTDRPVGVNVFVPGEGPAEPPTYAAYLERLAAWGRERDLEPGEPRYSDDEWEGKLELLRREPVEVVSFAFGAPPPAVVRALQAAGSQVWVTVTSPQEAREAAAAGADALVVQGAEAGGHRACFRDRPGLAVLGLLSLLQLVRASVGLPLVAAGAVATAAGLEAVLAAGAAAAQLGTAFMLSPEAGTTPAHREAISSDAPTALTRCFTGRLARGIENALMRELPEAPVAYPEIHYATAPMRKLARERGDADAFNLWAGEAHSLASALPAAEIVESIARGRRVRQASARR